MKEFFKKLKETRENRAYTQQQMAEKLGISVTQYQNYEYKTLPPHGKLLELNRILSTDLSVYIYQKKVVVNTGNNSDPPQDLMDEIKRLKNDLENKEKTINNLNFSLDELRTKYSELEEKYNRLNAEPSRKTGTDE